MKEYHAVSFSGGKDSTALLLRMLELGMPVDEIIFCDTGQEFPQMYSHIDKVEEYIGRKITRLKREKSFEYLLLEHKVNTRKEGSHEKGYSFPGPLFRWCTAYFKREAVEKHLREIKKEYKLIQYIGIAADEPKRIKDKRYPLVEWNWKESDCLEYCYSKGFTWDGLYTIFDRVSCWCCPLQSLEEFRKLRKHFPQLWQQLLDWQGKTWRNFTPKYSAFDLEERFRLEEERARQGLPIGRNRDFHRELKERLGKTKEAAWMYTPAK